MEKKISEVKNDSSVEINRNTKGFTYSVKAYGSNNLEIQEKLVVLLDLAKTLVEKEEKNAD